MFDILFIGTLQANEFPYKIVIIIIVAAVQFVCFYSLIVRGKRIGTVIIKGKELLSTTFRSY